MSFRIGFGYDAHSLIEGRPLMLGGEQVPFERGLNGHSDADVLLHAIMDALLGAAAMGDIGRCFPDSDPRYKDIESLLLLSQVWDKLMASHFNIANIDATIVAQLPKLTPYMPKMAGNIARCLRLPDTAVNVKATTEEGMGFTGTGQGMAAYAICMVIIDN